MTTSSNPDGSNDSTPKPHSLWLAGLKWILLVALAAASITLATYLVALAYDLVAERTDTRGDQAWGLVVSAINLFVVVLLAIWVFRYQTNGKKRQQLMELAFEFNKGEFYRLRNTAASLVVTKPARKIQDRTNWEDTKERDQETALWSVLGFYEVVQQAIDDGQVSKNRAIRVFGSTFVWWYVHAVNLDADYTYPEKFDYDNKLNRLFVSCVTHKRRSSRRHFLKPDLVGKQWLEYAKSEFSRREFNEPQQLPLFQQGMSNFSDGQRKTENPPATHKTKPD